MKQQLNPPANWNDFEDLCHKLWRSIWGDPNTQKHGRKGQAQHGIDIYGKPSYASGYLLPLHPGIKLGYLVNGC